MMDKIEDLVESLAQIAVNRSIRVATAESCTGGWISKTLTDRAGSSQWFECGFTTYSNEAKHGMLGVDSQLIEQYGAVSEPVVAAMTAGALARSNATIAVAVSGVAGPGGGSPQKPVGTVWFSWQIQGQPAETQRILFDGDRESVRKQTVYQAIAGIVERIAD